MHILGSLPLHLFCCNKEPCGNTSKIFRYMILALSVRCEDCPQLNTVYRGLLSVDKMKTDPNNEITCESSPKTFSRLIMNRRGTKLKFGVHTQPKVPPKSISLLHRTAIKSLVVTEPVICCDGKSLRDAGGFGMKQNVLAAGDPEAVGFDLYTRLHRYLVFEGNCRPLKSRLDAIITLKKTPSADYSWESDCCLVDPGNSVRVLLYSNVTGEPKKNLVKPRHRHYRTFTVKLLRTKGIKFCLRPAWKSFRPKCLWQRHCIYKTDNLLQVSVALFLRRYTVVCNYKKLFKYLQRLAQELDSTTNKRNIRELCQYVIVTALSDYSCCSTTPFLGSVSNHRKLPKIVQLFRNFLRKRKLFDHWRRQVSNRNARLIVGEFLFVFWDERLQTMAACQNPQMLHDEFIIVGFHRLPNI